MAGYQSLTLIGNTTREPELTYTPAGVACCKWGLAVNKSWTDKSTNEKREKVTYFTVTAWRGLAETCQSHVTKGMQMMVVGEIDASAYTAKDGDVRATLEVTADKVIFLGSRRDGDSDQSGNTEALPF